MIRVTTVVFALATLSMLPGAAAAQDASLKNPAALKEQAPATYKVKFDTSVGPVVIQVTRAWAPNGADRFYNLVKNGFFDDSRFFRVVPNFMVQFGIYGDPAVQKGWANANIQDDPVKQTNKKGYLTFATRGPNTRTTQVFVNLKANAFLDAQGFAPFGEVISGMAVVEKITSQYGEKPVQPMIQSGGNAYLSKEFPKLDFIKKATIEK